MKAPRLWVFAGPNGAGKSTVIGRYVPPRLTVVNPDEIAKALDDSIEGAARIIEAGRQALRRRADLLAGRENFAVETTLTGRSPIQLIRSARDAGFRIGLIFVGLDDRELSINRVHARVQRGGHDVPLDDLRRRFDRSMANLPEAMTFADRVILLDNSGRRRRLVLSMEHGRVKYASPDWPAWASLVRPPATT